jgi:hypothetical protein
MKSPKFFINGKEVKEKEFKQMENHLEVIQNSFSELMGAGTIEQSRQAIDKKTKKRYNIGYQSSKEGTAQYISEIVVGK